MSRLVRGTELVGRSVVTLGGEDVAQVKDVVYDASGGVRGFTLNGRGVFAGPLKVALPIGSVHAVGGDAVMVVDEGVLVDRDEVVAPADVRDRNILGDRVVTEDGTDLGVVIDVVLQVGATTEVVGYEVRARDADHPDGGTTLIPLPVALAVSGEALVVPSGVLDFAATDLAGLGAAVAAFRRRWEGRADAVQ